MQKQAESKNGTANNWRESRASSLADRSHHDPGRRTVDQAMNTYRIHLVREVELQIDLPASSKLEAMRIVQTMALDYDDRDSKSTRIISVKEVTNQRQSLLDPLAGG